MIFEAQLAGGIALYDVSDVLPRHKAKNYRNRPVADIVRQYHHHSGALGLPGLPGAAGAARYRIRKSGWPGHPYHFWLSYQADRDEQGRIVVYRCQPDAVLCYHTGGLNGGGLGICWQGNLTKRPPSSDQIEAAEALIPWLIERYPGIGISWHSEAARWGGRSKPACPGPFVEDWLREYREAA